MNVLNKMRSPGNQLTQEDEAQILENILIRCGKGNNTIPLEDLNSYSGYRSERYMLLRAGIIFVLLLFLLLPALFFYPVLTVKQRTDTSANRRAYNVTVDTCVPIKTITAESDGKTVPIYEAAGNEYIIIPSENGNVHVTVTLQNNQRAQTDIAVSGIDLDAPTVADSYSDETYLYICLSDASAIDGSSLTLTAADGSSREGAVFDAGSDRIIVNYPDEDLVLTISDIYGNQRHIELNTHN